MDNEDLKLKHSYDITCPHCGCMLTRHLRIPAKRCHCGTILFFGRITGDSPVDASGCVVVDWTENSDCSGGNKEMSGGR